MTSPQENVIYDEGGLLISQSRIVLYDGTTYQMSSVNGVRFEHHNRIQGGGWAAIVLALILFHVIPIVGIIFLDDANELASWAFLLLGYAALLAAFIWGLRNRRPEYDVTFSVTGISPSTQKTLKFKQDEGKALRVAEAINQAIIASGSTG